MTSTNTAIIASAIIGVMGIASADPLPVRAVDPYSGGSWKTVSAIKPWTADGDEADGTDGHCFYNVTSLGGSGAGGRPVGENLRISLPACVVSVTPLPSTVTARDYGYLEIDDPDAAPPATVESGLLVLSGGAAGDEIDLLELALGTEPGPHGVRVGVLVGNADKVSLSP